MLDFNPFKGPLVIAVVAVVYCLALVRPGLAQNSAKPGGAAGSAPPRVENARLPVQVQEMRDAIVAAAEAGDLEEMRAVLEWNELRPDLGIKREEDAIEAWRARSRDGNGMEVLATLSELLSGASARLPIGRDIENNDVFVWPYLSELDGKALDARQIVQLYRMVPADVADGFIKSGKWDWYRVAIGADGTWHIFAKPE